MDFPPTTAAHSNPTPEEPVWRALFADGSPREVLARVIEGDPLDLRGRCEARLRNQALLLDARRLQLRAAAHIARHAPGYTGTPPIDVWLAERIRKSVQELLEEQAVLAADGEAPEPPNDERLQLISETFGIDPSVFGRGCVRFNRAPFDARASFYGLILEAKPPVAWAAANSMTVERAMRSLRAALWALGVDREVDLDELTEGDADEE